MTAPETVCPYHHRPLAYCGTCLDTSNAATLRSIGRIPAQESETDSKDFDELLRRAARPNVDTLIEYWIAQGRSEEQIHGVRNFFSGVGRVLKSPAEAEQSSTLSDSSIPPTPAGEGELDRLIASKEWRLNCTGYDEGQMCCVEAGHPNRARLDAYIARRVLEELEALRPLVHPHDGNDMVTDILNERIAVIKKESQQ